ncbi:unnamed protein product [Urochloa humidicola]
MAPEKPPQANDHRCSRPKGVAHAAAMAAAMTIFLVVAAACTALLLTLVVAARASRRHRSISRYCVPSSLEPSPPPPRHRAVLSPADLHRLPSFAFPDAGGGDENPASTCAVCLEAARAGERWRAMPACRHAFHADCVDRWLATRSAACPLCRTAVVTASSMG